MCILQLAWLSFRWFASPQNRELLNRDLVPWAIGVTLISSGLFVVMPSRLVDGIHGAWHLATHSARGLLVLLVACLVVGTISANFRIVYRDEKACLVACKVVADGGVKALFGSYQKTDWLGKHHPPLTPILYGGVMAVFGSNLFVMRMVTMVFGILTMLATYWVGQELYDRGTGLVAALALLSTRGFTNVSVTANNDILMTFFFCLSALLTIRMLRIQVVSLAVATGLSLGLGLLTKYTMVLIFSLIIGCSLILGSLRNTKLLVGIAILLSATIGGIWLWYANHIGILQGQSQQMGRIARYGAGHTVVVKLRLLLDFVSHVGVYNIPLFLLGGFQIVRARCRSDLVILIWIAAVAIPLIATFPNARYFLPCYPALTIMLARWNHDDDATLSLLPVVLGILYCLTTMFFFLFDWSHSAVHITA